MEEICRLFAARNSGFKRKDAIDFLGEAYSKFTITRAIKTLVKLGYVEKKERAIFVFTDAAVQ